MSANGPTWSLDPDSFVPSRSDGKAMFTGSEFDRQAWPPCPVCGDPIEVDAIPTPTLDGGETMFITGRVRCWRGCDWRKIQT